MPKVSPSPQNQCTFDDPTDGADLTSATPSPAVPGPVASAGPTPPCLAQEPAAGGATSECTDELVRNFGGGDGAGPFAPSPLDKERSCDVEVLSTLANCGKVALEASKKKLDGFNAMNCAVSLASLAKCEFGAD